MEASLEELLAKRTDVVGGEEEEDTLLDLSREERMESLSFRAVPNVATTGRMPCWCAIKTSM